MRAAPDGAALLDAVLHTALHCTGVWRAPACTDGMLLASGNNLLGSS